MCDHTTYNIHACAPAATRSYVTTVCLFLGRCRPFRVFCIIAFSSYLVLITIWAVYLVRFPSGWCFFYLVTTGWVFTSISSYYMRIHQAGAERDGRTRLARPNNSQARTEIGKCSFFCPADHEQDWQPSCTSDALNVMPTSYFTSIIIIV